MAAVDSADHHVWAHHDRPCAPDAGFSLPFTADAPAPAPVVLLAPTSPPQPARTGSGADPCLSLMLIHAQDHHMTLSLVVQ